MILSRAIPNCNFKGLFALLFLCFTLASIGQKKVEILNTEEVIFDEAKYGKNQFLKGNVKLKHEGTIMYCDQAQITPGNDIIARGNVKFNQGDTLFMYGDECDYWGELGEASLRHNVKIIDKKVKLEGPEAKYLRHSSHAFYTKRSRITIFETGDYIESNKGNYFSNENLVLFVDSVVFTGSDGQVFTDSLRYNTETNIARFLTPTKAIRDDSSSFFAQKGIYYRETKNASFFGFVNAADSSNYIYADSLWYSDTLKRIELYQNVFIQDTVNDWAIKSDYAEYYKELDSASFPILNQLQFLSNKTDTTFIKTDSLTAYSKDGNRYLEAFGDIKIFGKEFQGLCKKLKYSQSDSLLTLFTEPVLWNGNSQITGTKIDMVLGKDGIERMDIPKSSFITEKVDSIRYNQIKGRELSAYFKNGDINNIVIKGNGEAIYYAFDEKSDSTGVILEKTFIGVNQSQCSDMEVIMKLDGGGIANIRFLTKPDNKLTPAVKSLGQEFVLDGLQWLGNVKPTFDSVKISD